MIKKIGETEEGRKYMVQLFDEISSSKWIDKVPIFLFFDDENSHMVYHDQSDFDCK